MQCWCIALMLELVKKFWLFRPRVNSCILTFCFVALNKDNMWFAPHFAPQQGAVVERIILEKPRLLYFEVFSWSAISEFLNDWAIPLYSGLTLNVVSSFHGNNRLEKLLNYVSVFTRGLSFLARDAWGVTVIYLEILSSCFLFLLPQNKYISTE